MFGFIAIETYVCGTASSHVGKCLMHYWSRRIHMFQIAARSRLFARLPIFGILRSAPLYLDYSVVRKSGYFHRALG